MTLSPVTTRFARADVCRRVTQVIQSGRQDLNCPVYIHSADDVGSGLVGEEQKRSCTGRSDDTDARSGSDQEGTGVEVITWRSRVKRGRIPGIDDSRATQPATPHNSEQASENSTVSRSVSGRTRLGSASGSWAGKSDTQRHAQPGRSADYAPSDVRQGSSNLQPDRPHQRQCIAVLHHPRPHPVVEDHSPVDQPVCEVDVGNP
jgi:hypothetical protein